MPTDDNHLLSQMNKLLAEVDNLEVFKEKASTLLRDLKFSDEQIAEASVHFGKLHSARNNDLEKNMHLGIIYDEFLKETYEQNMKMQQAELEEERKRTEMLRDHLKKEEDIDRTAAKNVRIAGKEVPRGPQATDYTSQNPTANFASTYTPPKKEKKSSVEGAAESAGEMAGAALGAEGGPAGMAIGSRLGGLAGKMAYKKVSFWTKFLMGGFVVMLLLMLLRSAVSWVANNIYYIGLAMLTMAGIALLTSRAVQKDFFNVYGLFFAVTLGIHMFYVFRGFVAGTFAIALCLGVYLVIAGMFWALAGRNRQTFIYALMMSIITVVLLSLPPLLQNYGAPEIVFSGATALATFIALWPGFMLVMIKNRDEDGIAAWILKVATVGMMFIAGLGLFYFLFTAASMLPQGNNQGVDTTHNLAVASQFVVDKFNVVMGKAKSTIDQSMNPGEYYRGQIEENKDKKKVLGVTIDYLKTDRQVTNETPISVVGAVTARSFISPSILIVPSCVIERKDAPPAEIEPRQIEVLFGATKSYWCTFPPMPKGTYSVKGSASFPFETWAYITYTFVDEERAMSIARQGKDIKQVLNLGNAPIATYTTGPVSIGMEGSDHPLIINPSKTVMMQGSQIGITVDNSWGTEGELKWINRIDLKVPSPFVIKNCTRDPVGSPIQDDREPTYMVYTFEPEPLKNEFSSQTITCKLDVSPEKKDEAVKLLSEGDAVVRTFVAVVNYEYSVKKTTTVQVK